MLEKTDLLLTTQELIREVTPNTSDLLLHAGIERLQRNVLNYYREDLDYPLHSARAIVSLASAMLHYIEGWAPEDIHPVLKAHANLRKLLEIWDEQLEG